MGTLHIISGNIVSDEILKLGDAIVNPSNPMMRPGAGVSGEIFRKAGVDALENYAAQKFGISYFNPPGTNEMQITEVRITPGFALQKDIIFAQGPKIWEYEELDEAITLLLQTYQNICETAKENGYKSILIPSLGTGEYGFSHEMVAEKVVTLLQKLSGTLDIELYLVLYEHETTEYYLTYQRKA